MPVTKSAIADTDKLQCDSCLIKSTDSTLRLILNFHAPTNKKRNIAQCNRTRQPEY